jgi:branched-chain amino acid transport system ATP-binding protein
MNPILTMQALKTGYGRLVVSEAVQLRVMPGETVGIVGVNGAGKSTLLKTVSGLLPSLGGSVFLGSTEITRWPAHRRTRGGLALVPEGRQVLGGLTVFDNLELARASYVQQSDQDSFQARLREVFGLFPRLHERGKNPGSSLSGGEQQMLAVARALLTRPKLMMLDEPTQGLAPVVVEMLRQTLVGFKGRFPMLLVEQNRKFIDAVADRVLEMRSGQLVEL